MAKRAKNAQYAYGITVEVVDYQKTIGEFEKKLKGFYDTVEKATQSFKGLNNEMKSGKQVDFSNEKNQLVGLVAEMEEVAKWREQLAGGQKLTDMFDGLDQVRQSLTQVTGQLDKFGDNIEEIFTILQNVPQNTAKSFVDIRKVLQEQAGDMNKIIKELNNPTEKTDVSALKKQLSVLVADFANEWNRAASQGIKMDQVVDNKAFAGAIKSIIDGARTLGSEFGEASAAVLETTKHVVNLYNVKHPTGMFKDMASGMSGVETNAKKAGDAAVKFNSAFKAAISIADQFAKSDMGLGKKSKDLEAFLNKLKNPQITIDVNEENVSEQFEKLADRYFNLLSEIGDVTTDSLSKIKGTDKLNELGTTLQNIIAIGNKYTKDLIDTETILDEEELNIYQSDLKKLISEIKKDLDEVNRLIAESGETLKAQLEKLGLGDIELQVKLADLTEEKAAEYVAKLNKFVDDLTGQLANKGAIELPVQIKIPGITPDSANSKKVKEEIGSELQSFADLVSDTTKTESAIKDAKSKTVSKIIANAFGTNENLTLYLEHIKTQFKEIRDTVREQKKSVQDLLTLDFTWNKGSTGLNFSNLFTELQDYFADPENALKVEIDDKYLKERISGVFKDSGININMSSTGTPMDQSQLAALSVALFKGALSEGGFSVPPVAKKSETTNAQTSSTPTAVTNKEVPKFVFDIKDFRTKYSSELTNGLNETLSNIVEAIKGVGKNYNSPRTKDEIKSKLQAAFGSLDLSKVGRMTSEEIELWIQNSLLKADETGKAMGGDLIDALSKTGIKWKSLGKFTNVLDQFFIKINSETRDVQDAINDRHKLEVLKDFGYRARAIKSKYTVSDKLEKGTLDLETLIGEREKLRSVQNYKNTLPKGKAEGVVKRLDDIVAIYTKLIQIFDGTTKFDNSEEKQKEIESLMKELNNIKTHDDNNLIKQLSGRISIAKKYSNGKISRGQTKEFKGNNRSLESALSAIERAGADGIITIRIDTMPNDKESREFIETVNETGKTITVPRKFRDGNIRGEGVSSLTSAREERKNILEQEIDFKPFVKSRTIVDWKTYNADFERRINENESAIKEQERIIEDAEKKIADSIRTSSKVSEKIYKDVDNEWVNYSSSILSKAKSSTGISDESIKEWANKNADYTKNVQELLNNALSDLENLAKEKSTDANKKKIQGILQYIDALKSNFEKFKNIEREIYQAYNFGKDQKPSDVKFEDLASKGNILDTYRQGKEILQRNIDEINKELADIKKQKESIRHYTDEQKSLAKLQFGASKYYSEVSQVRSFEDLVKNAKTEDERNRYNNLLKNAQNNLSDPSGQIEEITNFINELTKRINSKSIAKEEKERLSPVLTEAKNLLKELQSVVSGGKTPMFSMSESRYNDIISDSIAEEERLAKAEREKLKERQRAERELAELERKSLGARVLRRAESVKQGEGYTDVVDSAEYDKKSAENLKAQAEERLKDLNRNRETLQAEKEKLEERKKYNKLLQDERVLKQEIAELGKKGLSTAEKETELEKVKNRIKRAEKKLGIDFNEVDVTPEKAFDLASEYDAQQKLLQGQIKALKSNVESYQETINSINRFGFNSARGDVAIRGFVDGKTSEFIKSDYYKTKKDEIKDKYLKGVYRDDGTLDITNTLEGDTRELVAKYSDSIDKLFFNVADIKEGGMQEFINSLINDPTKFSNAFKGNVEVGKNFIDEFDQIKTFYWSYIQEEEGKLIKDYKDSIQIDKSKGTASYTSYEGDEIRRVVVGLKEQIVANLEAEIKRLQPLIDEKSDLLYRVSEARGQALKYSGREESDLTNIDIEAKISSLNSKINDRKSTNLANAQRELEEAKTLDLVKQKELEEQIANQTVKISNNKKDQARLEREINEEKSKYIKSINEEGLESRASKIAVERVKQNATSEYIGSEDYATQVEAINNKYYGKGEDGKSLLDKTIGTIVPKYKDAIYRILSQTSKYTEEEINNFIKLIQEDSNIYSDKEAYFKLKDTKFKDMAKTLSDDGERVWSKLVVDYNSAKKTVENGIELDTKALIKSYLDSFQIDESNNSISYTSYASGKAEKVVGDLKSTLIAAIEQEVIDILSGKNVAQITNDIVGSKAKSLRVLQGSSVSLQSTLGRLATEKSTLSETIDSGNYSEETKKEIDKKLRKIREEEEIIATLEKEVEAWGFVRKAREEASKLTRKTNEEREATEVSRIERYEKGITENKAKQVELQNKLDILRGEEQKDTDAILRTESELADVAQKIADLETKKQGAENRLGNIRKRIESDGQAASGGTSGGLLSPIVNLLTEIRDILSKMSGIAPKSSSGSPTSASGDKHETNRKLEEYWKIKNNGRPHKPEEWKKLKEDLDAGKLTDFEEVLARGIRKDVEDLKESVPKSSDIKDNLTPVLENGVSDVAEEVVKQGAEEGKKIAKSESNKSGSTSETKSTSGRAKYAGGLSWAKTKEKIKSGASKVEDGLSLDEYVSQAQSLYNQVNSWVGEHNIEYFSKRLDLGRVMQKAALAAKKENPDKKFKNNAEWYKYIAEQYNMGDVNKLALTSKKIDGNKEIMAALADVKPVDTTPVTDAIQNISNNAVKAGAKSAEKAVETTVATETTTPTTSATKKKSTKKNAVEQLQQTQEPVAEVPVTPTIEPGAVDKAVDENTAQTPATAEVKPEITSTSVNDSLKNVPDAVVPVTPEPKNITQDNVGYVSNEAIKAIKDFVEAVSGMVGKVESVKVSTTSESTSTGGTGTGKQQKVKKSLTDAQIAALNVDDTKIPLRESIKKFTNLRNWNDASVDGIGEKLGLDNKTLVEYKNRFQELAKIALDLKAKGESGTIITKEDLANLDTAIAGTKTLQSQLIKDVQFKSMKDAGLIVSGKSKIKSTDGYSERQEILAQYAKKYAAKNKSEYQFGQYDFINDKISFDMIDSSGKVTKTVIAWSDAFNSAYVQSSKLQGSLDAITQEVYKTDEAIKAGEEYGFFQVESEGLEEYKAALAEYEKQVKVTSESSQEDLAKNFELLHQAQLKAVNAGKDLLDKQKDAYGFNSAQNVLGRQGNVGATLQHYRDQGYDVNSIKLVQNYNNAITALKNKMDELKQSGKLWDSKEQGALKVLADQAAEAEKALLGADAAQRQLNGEVIKGGQASFFEGVNKSDINQVKQAMMEYAMSIDGVNKTSIKWNEAQKTVTYTVKTGKREVSDFTVGISNLTNEFYNARTGARVVKTGMEQFLDSVGAKFKEVGRYILSFGSFYRIWGEIQKGYQYVKEIDTALTELKKVTDETDETYSKFLKTMSQTGAEVGATVSNLTNMAASWARLGYNIEQAGELAKNTAILLNVSEFTDADTASEALISTIQAYGYAAEESMGVVDILNEVGKFIARR